jgi:iron complex transport system permease protein
MRRPEQSWLWLALCSTALVAACVLAIAWGSVDLTLATVLASLRAHLLGQVGPAGPDDAIVWLLRAPRVVLACLVGACLAVSGCCMQGLFRNPLASPDIVGSSAGGALGAVLAIVTGLAQRSLYYLPLLSFGGSLASLLAVYTIATRRGRTPMATLLLAGVALGSLASAFTSLLISLHWVRWEVAQDTVFWLMGGLEERTWEHVWLMLPVAVVGLGATLGHARALDTLQLGEETALATGLEVEAVKRNLITVAAVLVGGAVAVSGMIGFVGLIVPHAVRRVVGPRHATLLPACAVSGALFLVLADLVARLVVRPEELRLGIVTAVVGAPFFLWLLVRHEQHSQRV